MNWLICEDALVRARPLKIKKTERGNIRMECVIQTEGNWNKNKRRYPKSVLEYAIKDVTPMVQEGALMGELDHPISKDPSRQATVLFEKVSHRFLDFGWDGNKLVAVIETLSNFHGKNLRNICLDGVPIGWSFRGMGDLKKVWEGREVMYEVQLPMKPITWDAVTNPSHDGARVIRLNESAIKSIHTGAQKLMESGNNIVQNKFIHEATGLYEANGMVCTAEGICYLPNQFDELIETRVVELINKFK